MKLPVGVILILLLAVTTLGGDIQHEETQAGMNEAAEERLKAAEAEMVKVLDSLIRKAEGKPEAVKKLRRAQAAWEAYRDAQIDAVWPFPERGSYGSVYRMCFAEVKRQLIETRTRELKSMLEPKEGDVCSSQWPE